MNELFLNILLLLVEEVGLYVIKKTRSKIHNVEGELNMGEGFT